MTGVQTCALPIFDKVRINFKVATTLRLVNDSVATTKGAPNNINFELVSDDRCVEETGLLLKVPI